MIQDIAPHIYHNQFKKQSPDDQSMFLFYTHGQLLSKHTDDETLDYFTFEDIKHFLPDYADYIFDHSVYLFAVDDQRFFLFLQPLNRETADHTLLPSHKTLAETFCEFGGQFKPIMELRLLEPQHMAFAGVTGHQLHNWYNSKRYCGKCGHELTHSEKERMMHCDHCNHMEYPQLCPAVIVAVINGDKILLTKYEGRAFKRYALIAGYAEIGETIEECVHREVFEEVGVKVKNLTYYKSQPWSFSGTLLFGFYCELDGDDTITLDTEELSVGEWVHRDNIPADGDRTSLTREMMVAFKEGLIHF